MVAIMTNPETLTHKEKHANICINICSERTWLLRSPGLVYASDDAFILQQVRI